MDSPGSPIVDRTGGWRISVKTLIVLVATCAVIFWSIRTLWEDVPVNRLVKSLHYGDPSDRRDAATNLGSVGSEDLEVVIPALIGALRDGDEGVRSTVARSLGLSGGFALRSGLNPGLVSTAVRGLVAALEDVRPSVRAAAAGGLYVVYSAATGSPVVKDYANEQGQHLYVVFSGAAVSAQSNAVTGLLPSETVIHPLVALMGDGSEAVRAAAATALGPVGRMASVAPPPELVAILEADAAPEVRAAAAAAIAYFRTGLDPATVALLRALEPEEPQVRTNCESALRAIQGDKNVRLSVATVPALTATLASRQRLVRFHAAALLAKFGPEAESSVPALLTVLREPLDSGMLDFGIRAYLWDPALNAARALGRVAPGTPRAKEVVAGLIETLRKPRSIERGTTVVQVLAGFTLAELEPALPVLIETIRRSTLDDRFLGPAAARTLGQIAPGTSWAGDAAAVLTAALESPSPSTQDAAAKSLGGFGRQAAEAMSRLRALVEGDPFPGVRKSAAGALYRIESDLERETHEIIRMR